jgi:hypothetical protein
MAVLGGRDQPTAQGCLDAMQRNDCPQGDEALMPSAARERKAPGAWVLFLEKAEEQDCVDMLALKRNTDRGHGRISLHLKPSI